ncbi:MAG: hypothetical protein KatS3mg131_1294 [Candidatus Tectimicrobiota bacterium]|nr:MAG: hypothetical protein KatS3mg131_1294 [Candidatus Tectomicrobia bacterium]
MGTSAILYTGLRALLAQQTAIHVAGQNIANVNTPGYSRQRVHLVADQIPQRGALLTAGVSVAEITRVVDRFLTAQLTATSAAAASTQAQADFLNHIEALFNELPLEDAGLAGLLDRFFQAFHDLAARPQGLPERTVVREQGQALAEAFQQLAQGLADTQRALTTAIAAEVTQINRLAGRLAELNLEIQRVEVDPTQHANTLRDERDQVLRQLAERVQVTAFETAGGLTVLLGGGRPLVEGARASTLVTQADADDPQQVHVLLQDPQGHRVAVDDRILGGRLHGLLQLKAGFRARGGSQPRSPGRAADRRRQCLAPQRLRP